MKFAIRDDDTSFFTSPDDLEKAYSFIPKGCISLSVVPSSVPKHKDSVFPYGKEIPYAEYKIENNTELNDYLKKMIKQGRYEILLHGYSHEYKIINSVWQPEMKWKDSKRIINEISEGKKRLERLYDTTVSVFVAPNNYIDKKGINAIEINALNYSGIIQHMDRKIDIKYCINYLNRWTYRLIYGIPRGKIYNFGSHKELVAYAPDDYDRLIREYKECKKRGYPFVIYTHYWNLLRRDPQFYILKRITEYVLDDGADLVPLSKCFI